MPKHGTEMHFVRPDRVYATGVLTPVVGYQPAEDAQQVAARFVGGGTNFGLAGPQIQVFRGARVDSVVAKLRALFAGITVRWQAARLRQQMRMGRKLLPPGQAKKEVDTSPRPTQPYPGAIPTQGGWGPQPQTPSGTAEVVTNNGAFSQAPAVLPSIAAGLQIAPSGAGMPASIWNNTIAQDVPATVAQRGGNDVLTKFFATLAGARRRRW